MNVLVIGGSGFIGPALVRELQKRGHGVAVFHRGSSAAVPEEVELIIGDRRNLGDYIANFRRLAPDVVVDLILSSGKQAKALMETFRGIARRVVAISSMDVYRAAGVLHGSEPGPLEPLPLTEESPLRKNQQTYPPATLNKLQSLFAWVDDEYDKVAVERAVLAPSELPSTILRLPMVYGPGDSLHRFFPMLKRMDDGRPKILLSEDLAAWRSPRGYVDNVAGAIALAAISERATGRVYNVAEEPAFSELEWAKKIAFEAGWRGEFVVLPAERTPSHLRVPGNLEQHWVASSRHIREELGYREDVPIEEAISRTIAWQRVHPPSQVSPQQFDYAAEDAAVAA